MSDFKGVLLCEVTGAERVNAKEYRFLLNPDPVGLTLTVPEVVVREWLPQSRLYLFISSVDSNVENFDDHFPVSGGVFRGELHDEDGNCIRIIARLLPVEILPEIHKKAGKDWNRIIGMTMNYMKNFEKSCTFVEKYQMQVLKQKLQRLRNGRPCVSELSSVVSAMWRKPEFQLLNKRLPDEDDLKHWICEHAATAVDREIVILDHGAFKYDLELLIHGYLGV